GTVRFCVSDNGPGMAEEAKHRGREPFYTTKAREVSTGLGLALVGAIVKRIAGSIEIQSEPGQGAAFRLRLPALAPSTAGAGLAAQQPDRRAVAAVTGGGAPLLPPRPSPLPSLDYQIDSPPREGARRLVAP